MEDYYAAEDMSEESVEGETERIESESWTAGDPPRHGAPEMSITRSSCQEEDRTGRERE